MPKAFGFWYVSADQRRRAAKGMSARRHGATVVYPVDSEPVVLQVLAKQMGCTLEQLSDRVARLRKAGTTITLAALTKPLRRTRRA